MFIFDYLSICQSNLAFALDYKLAISTLVTAVDKWHGGHMFFLLHDILMPTVHEENSFLYQQYNKIGLCCNYDLNAAVV